MFARQQQVHDGHDEQREHGAEAHSADDDPADLVASLCARAGRYGERHRSQHHGACCHQYGAQPERRRFEHGVELVVAQFPQLVRKLDDQDADSDVNYIVYSDPAAYFAWAPKLKRLLRGIAKRYYTGYTN